MKCIECQINKNLFGEEQNDYEINGLQEVNDLCSFHNEIFEVEE